MEIALLSCESKQTGVPHALCGAIPIMEMLKEIEARGFPMASANAETHCKVFEDNSGALEIAQTHKCQPQTKHLNAKSHHF